MTPTVRDLLLDRLETGSTPGDRTDNSHVVLAVEGGGMRGAVSSGMLLALEQLGLRNSFDEVVGTSAGAISGAFFVAGRGTSGSALYYTVLNSQRFVDRRRLIRSGSVMDLDYLIDEAFEHTGFTWTELINSDIPLWATVTPASADNTIRLVRVDEDEDQARHVLAATANLPVLAGGSRAIGEHSYVDGGLLEAVPWNSAIKRGATHVLVVRSRHFNDNGDPEDPNLFERAAVPRVVRRMHGDHVADLVNQGSERFWIVTESLRAIVEGRASAIGTEGHEPVVEAVLPPIEASLPDRLEVDTSVLMDALTLGAKSMVDYLDLEGFTVEQRVVVNHPRAPVGTVRTNALIPIVRTRRNGSR